MRLHRLRVENFRGVASREIEFAEAGVTVIEGDNEAGKSSMMEAFDLLLTAQSSSKARSVRAVQPAGRDVGTEVWADISCGPWRFEYFKRFNRQPETTLTIVEPLREQFAGREAHERVDQILAESLDRSLFEALRLLQSADPALGDLANSSALSQALDRAAGQAEAGGGESPQTLALVAAVTAEYKKYFTLAQGRPTGELAQAVATADDAAAKVAQRQAFLATAQDAADRLPRVVERVRQLVADEQTGNVEFAQAAAALAEAEAVGEQEAAACATAQAKQLAHQVAAEACDSRVALRERLAKLRATVDENTAAAEQATALADAADAQAAEVADEVAAAAASLAAVRRQLSVAETAAVVAADRARLVRLESALDEVARLGAELDAVRKEVEAITVTPDDVALAARLDRDITAATARLEAVAGTVAVTRLGDTAVLVDGEELADGIELTTATNTVIDVPGTVRVEIRPGADSAAMAAELDSLRAREAELLRRCGVAAVTDVAAVAGRRAEAQRRTAELERGIARELAGSRPEDLDRQRLDILARLPETESAAETGDPVQLRADERTLAEAVSAAERRRDALAADAGRARVRAQTLTESGARLAEETSAVDAELARAVAEASDDALADRSAAAAGELEAATAALTAVRRRLHELDLAGLRTRVADVDAAQGRLRKQLSEARRLQAELSTMLDICRSDGRLDELSEAEADDEAAQAQLKRVSRRAAGARALYETLQRQRNESRARYVDPFTRRLEELAAPVFGDGVTFHIDDDFVITTRTLDGVTVDVDALSGGAKEQLGLLARLACATLVDTADGVPLILDDALGYTDPTRLSAMAQVLGTSGGDAQIIVLTCTPDRYREVAVAKLIGV